MILISSKIKKMSKAEEVAINKYPHNVYGGTLGDSLRAACMVGYHQAEKDLALTIEDIERIDIYLCGIRANKSSAFTFRKLSDEQYQAVISRINQNK